MRISSTVAALFLSAATTTFEPGIALASAAAPAFLVVDVDPGIDPQAVSEPRGFVALGGIVVFNAGDATNGRELWRTDGTAAGTVRITDIRPGPASGVVPTYLGVAVLGDQVYFAADDGVHGTELWRSDGTAAGTRMVADLNRGEASSDPVQFLVADGTLLFVAHDDTAGVELWRTDGSALGTARIADINPGPADANPLGLTRFRDLIVFSAEDGAHGCELWGTDGTAGGTRLLKDTNPLPECYQRLQQGYPPFGDIYLAPRSFTPAGGVFFFTTDRALWRSDGTSEGTVLLRAFYSCSGFEAFRCPPSCMTAIDGVLYFQGDDYSTGREPWRSDGTPEGTVQIADLFPVPCRMSSSGDDCSSFACGFAPGGDGVLFTARDAFSSYGQWTTDGSAQGTRRLGAVPSDPGPYPGALPYPDPGVVLDGALIYGAGELFRHDGIAAGPQLLKDIMQVPASSYPDRYVRVGEAVLFFASDGAHGRELWRADRDGAALLVDIWPGAQSGDQTAPSYGAPVTFRDGAAFLANEGVHGTELWFSDGTAAGTRQVIDLAPGADSGLGVSSSYNVSSPQMIALRDQLLFVGRTDAHGAELWRTDGSAAGTEMLRDIWPGTTWSLPLELTRAGDRVFFTALDDRSYGRSLWGTDATAEGTERIDTETEPYALAAFGRRLAYFAAEADGGGVTLWLTDGDHTLPIRGGFAWSPGPPTDLVSAAGRLFFVASAGGAERRELWASDGTLEGTVPILSLPPDGADYIEWHPFGDRRRLLFVVGNVLSGQQLWSSDGTRAGTQLLAQLNDSFPTYLADFLVAAGETVFFTAVAANGGLRLWRSDGTVAGTALVPTISPPVAVSPFTRSAIAGRTLYLTADDGEHGVEPWAVPLDGLVAVCVHDCDANFTVDVADLVLGVRIALGTSPVAFCVAMDANQDSMVSIVELIAAVNEALSGC